jgi:LysR family transcriptional activator of mexEF-oprN operon
MPSAAKRLSGYARMAQPARVRLVALEPAGQDDQLKHGLERPTYCRAAVSSANNVAPTPRPSRSPPRQRSFALACHLLPGYPDLMSNSDRLPDLNLLRLFVALMEERHVTRAGERLFLSQPAASGGLKRLREQFHDMLLVREGQELRPTARAEELYATVAPLLSQLSDGVASAIPFDPATDHRTFNLGCSDAVTFALLPPLLTRFRQSAPGCALSVRMGDHHTLPHMLAASEVGMIIGYLGEELPANARVKTLHHSAWMVLRDVSTPSVCSMDAYCARPHALISGRGHMEGNIDALLRTDERERRVVLGLSSFFLLAAALPGTEMIATVPDYVARLISSRNSSRLVAEMPPVTVSPTPHSLAWNGSRDQDPAERWLRGEVIAAFNDVITV